MILLPRLARSSPFASQSVSWFQVLCLAYQFRLPTHPQHLHPRHFNEACHSPTNASS